MKRTLLVMLSMLVSQSFADSDSSVWTTKDSQGTGGSSAIIMPTLGVADMAIKGSVGNLQSDTGLSIGALVEVGHGYLTFQTGALYNEFGGKDTGAEGKEVLTLSYFNIPLLAKFNFMGNSERTVYAKAGVMPGILLSSEVRIPGASAGADSLFKTYDLPAAVGLGGTWPVPGIRGSVTLDATYVRGLTNVINADGGTGHNEGFIIGAGYSIPL